MSHVCCQLHPSERLAHHGLDGVRWQSDQSTEYDLYAIVKHIGGSSGGHYVAFGRCQVCFYVSM
jgi:ubiquitin C-terminal hydrolase